MSNPIPAELASLLEAADAAAREHAWDRFVSANTRLLLHTARTVCHEHDAAMDAYAYVLEALRQDGCRRLRAYDTAGRSRFTTWLVVVARRLCLDHHRQRYGRPRGTAPSAEQAHATRRRLLDLVAEDIEADRLPIGPPGDPQSQLEEEEVHRALAAAVAELEPRDRLLLKLRFEDDAPVREIARLLDFASPFHVYRRLNAVCALLRRALRRRGVEEPLP